MANSRPTIIIRDMTTMSSNEYNEILTHYKLSDKHKRGILIGSVFIFPLVFTSLIFSLIVFFGNVTFPEKIDTKSEFAEISQPVNRSTISKKFNISGTLGEVSENEFIYLVENREKKYWPKFALGNTPGEWNKSLNSRAKKGHFYSYLLVKVDKDNKDNFDDWFKTSRETGKYPGMEDIAFAQPVAKIRVKTK